MVTDQAVLKNATGGVPFATGEIDEQHSREFFYFEREQIICVGYE
jgi:hypothetical protein